MVCAHCMHACVWQFSGYSMPRHCPFPKYTSARRRPAAHEEHTTSSLCLSSALGCGDCLTPAQMQAELISITPQRDVLLKVSLLVMRAFGPGPGATSSGPEPQALSGFALGRCFSRHSGTTQRRSLEQCILPAWRGTGPHDAGERSCRAAQLQTKTDGREAYVTCSGVSRGALAGSSAARTSQACRDLQLPRGAEKLSSVDPALRRPRRPSRRSARLGNLSLPRLDS